MLISWLVKNWDQEQENQIKQCNVTLLTIILPIERVILAIIATVAPLRNLSGAFTVQQTATQQQEAAPAILFTVNIIFKKKKK